MNKRIKKKLTKQAIKKYDAKIELTHKERELIKVYIFLKEFDFSDLLNSFVEALKKTFTFIANFFKKAKKAIMNFNQMLLDKQRRMRYEAEQKAIKSLQEQTSSSNE